jgi:hypothetical protein
MSDNNEAVAEVDPTVQPFVDFWSSYIGATNDTTRQMLAGFNGSSDVKLWQRQWFDAVSRSMDAYMRSPAFLQAMRENTDVLIKAKRQADDWAAEFARNANIPTTSDISGLFERLHSVEEAILDRLGHIEERLSTIERTTGADQPAGT